MLPRTLVILGLLVAAMAAPGGSAAVPACKSSPPKEETARFPLDPNYYLLVTNDQEKFGFWHENNSAAGLQTEDCFNSVGILILQKDDKIRDFPVESLL